MTKVKNMIQNNTKKQGKSAGLHTVEGELMVQMVYYLSKVVIKVINFLSIDRKKLTEKSFQALHHYQI